MDLCAQSAHIWNFTRDRRL